MRIAITGADGFVGPHAVRSIVELLGNKAEIILTSRTGSANGNQGSLRQLDVTDRAAVFDFLDDFRPSHVLHLAGIAAISTARADVDVAWSVHLNGTLNVARAIMEKSPNCWLLNVSSGLVYGESARAGIALDETKLLVPTDEYSASKAAAEMALGALVFQGLRCMRLRPFNHSGPGQSENFVIPAIAMQVARIERGLVPPVIRVGNIHTKRDFLDVRDVTSAYSLAIMNSEAIVSGTILNISSGVCRSVGDLLDILTTNSSVPIEVQIDPSRIRKNDIAQIVGSAQCARDLLGWKPSHSFEGMVLDVLNYSRRVVQVQ
jgi:GDP-4-dehydro-6-deoxy-D-mannose reductase